MSKTLKFEKKNPLFGMFDAVVKAAVRADEVDAPKLVPYWKKGEKLKYIDLFCGIGGFHQAADELKMECVFASDIDEEARKAYEHNYGIKPAGDITGVRSKYIPDHDILFAGFPCQPFSIIGSREGFADARGTLFFEIARILKDKSPRAFVLENVRQLASHDGGKTLDRILEILRKELGYTVDFKILNALNFGVPQKRERVLIVGFKDKVAGFNWDKIKKVPMKPLSEILEKNPDPKHFVSERIKKARYAAHTPKVTPSIWHENKAGNISSHPFSCALRAGASYNYLLVNGERRLTMREMLRLQGFPEKFEIACNDSQMRKQAGNAVPVPMIKAVIKEVVLNAQRIETQRTSKAA
ncbi:MAG: DNA (cytosine-5-)-methyltransferase [Pyrinomonadaceae bacterium]